jgi:hypothetical protein
VIAGLWLVVPNALHGANAQQETGARDQDDPLEVTIRPRRKPLTEGYMQDDVLATDDGRYFLYTGWYIDRLGDRLAPGSLADRALRMGLADTVLEILREDPARDPVYIRDVGLILGGRYRGLSMLQIAGLFQVELGPTPFPKGGFYGARKLDAPWSMADQIIGPVDFSGSAR